MLDSYVRNSRALDNLITNSVTGSIPAELLDSGLMPISLMGERGDGIEIDDLTKEEPEKEDSPVPVKDNVIQFKRKNDEDK